MVPRTGRDHLEESLQTSLPINSLKLASASSTVRYIRYRPESHARFKQVTSDSPRRELHQTASAPRPGGWPVSVGLSHDSESPSPHPGLGPSHPARVAAAGRVISTVLDSRFKFSAPAVRACSLRPRPAVELERSTVSKSRSGRMRAGRRPAASQSPGRPGPAARCHTGRCCNGLLNKISHES